MNEVASISRTSHVNVVQLLGFCLEGKKKALIYEFMPNDSLDKFIGNKGLESTSSLSWDNLLQIAKGIARGLEYLFDIKPHNILLDDNFCPKISDLSWEREHYFSFRCERNNRICSSRSVQQTFWWSFTKILCVYDATRNSGSENNINDEATETSEYFPDWIYRKLEQDQDLRSDDVIGTKEKETERRMIAVSFWCIQTFPKDRPTHSRVIEMLEGNMNSQEIPQNLLLPQLDWCQNGLLVPCGLSRC
ncbi:LEAF RUST 10 DISEASE-RESISTANCE LOCUS RECEPTOR-LIKE PROTEIN KINASE-like 2.5 [Vigna radiata var. radiata]|uniref:LEAF RUST 10 DISEASE-RESISTANCE LOCUS RECEPTOR-LIKE PROTEIN KINASE-like 2.5 n=1 Tax=Vigna radiata var. radiata TaxID=3916 RepID=A0A1S3TSF7_VIGRR|nr:LEAF RUST 10 DISEASE-RESISTANCE LOCUS RECEPTOR-LIKE PROTEIN KINASE-like 2.5 [Vigna radiata var. radiata]